MKISYYATTATWVQGGQSPGVLAPECGDQAGEQQGGGEELGDGDGEHPHQLTRGPVWH